MSRFVNWVAVAMAATSLAAATACDSGDAAGAETVVDFWYYQPTPPQSQQVKALAREFEQANQNIKVKLTEIPKGEANYNTKLFAALAGDRAPDAGYLDQPLMARFAGAGQLAEVPPGTITESDYFEGALKTNKVDGKLYGVPLQQTTVVLFYNKRYVKAPPTTWDELAAESERVHRENPKVAGVALNKGDGMGAWIFPGFVASAGGTMLDEQHKKVTFAEQPGQQALALWHQLLASSPRKIVNSEKPFEKGLAAMMFSGPWDILAIRQQFPDLDFGVALLPKKVRNASTVGGDNGVVFAKSDSQQAAWKWLQFLGGGKHNATFSNITGNFPTNKLAAETANIYTDPAFAVVVEQLKTAQARPTVEKWIQINDDYLAKAIEQGVDGGRPPAEALGEAATKARKLLGWP